MSKTKIVARAQTKEGKQDAFLEAAKVVIEATRKEPGNLAYTLYQSPVDKTSFLFYEEYKNAESFTAHATSDHFKAFGAAIKDLLASELLIDQYQADS
ncbi:putative antibiotic biosynthesis monooxygenase [Blattamonas nauphoetae]|uniref:Antibiotic biosynthesis monooxygenase n=1 Tax=Blattamonas nauphoetae TaxID=2049346 RepID=A0ABQ9YME0_9EUKA|nr:putative antibiotic biosynthesis monooxygenase [Blattamonas nauphoetae]